MKKVKEAIKKITKKKTDEQKFEEWIRNKTNEILNQIILVPFCKVDYQFCYDKECQTHNNNMNITFSIRYQNCYKRALLVIHPVAYTLWKDNQKKDLIDCIIHECAHLHSIPLADLAKQRYVSSKEITNASEELTETIAEYIRGITMMTSDIYDD